MQVLPLLKIKAKYVKILICVYVRKFRNLWKVSTMKDGKKVVITYGTFDLFHQGHYNILKRAKDLGDYLIVGVTGETYDIERGKLSVKDSLVKRIENVKETGFADLIIVEEYLGQKIQDIIKYDVDILVVGSDWIGKFDHMNKYCEVKYLERTKNISSTMLRESDEEILKLGIVSDDLNDDEFIIESKYVSGIHAESVFSDDNGLAEQFSNKFELDKSFSDYDAFLKETDMVYIRCNRDNKYARIRQALESGKIVLSSPVLGNSAEEIRELYDCAKANNTVLVECLPTFYLQAFVQLLWNAKGNLIGDLVSVKNGFRIGGLAGIAEDDMKANIYFSSLVAEEFFGKGTDFSLDTVSYGDAQYSVLIGKSENGIYLSEIGSGDYVTTRMEIRGTEGEIIIPDDWWYTGYFELHKKNEENFKRYSWNFEGNGMRYVIMSALPKAGASPSSSDIRIPAEESIDALTKTNRLLENRG